MKDLPMTDTNVHLYANTVRLPNYDRHECASVYKYSSILFVPVKMDLPFPLRIQEYSYSIDRWVNTVTRIRSGI